MGKTPPKRLVLNREAIRELNSEELKEVQGANPMTLQCTWSGTITICRCASEVVC